MRRTNLVRHAVAFRPFWRSHSRLALAAAALCMAGSAPAAVTGFGGALMSGWTPNTNTTGIPSVSGTGTAADVLTLTTQVNSEADSYWFNTPQNITNFTESFTYTSPSNGGADGMTAAWQNAGTTALGNGGGGKGYTGISTASALAMNIYGGNSGSGSHFNNTIANGAGDPALTPTPNGVDLTSGHPIIVSLSYREADHALVEMMTDSTNPSQTFTRVWRGVSIQTQVGGTTALVGFTGGTGGINASQTITNFNFTSGNAPATPVATINPIAVSGFNQKMIISNAAGPSVITATMDGGTNKDGDTFYENGVNANATAAGVPRAGVVFGSENDSNHTFVLEPNGASANDAVLLDTGHTTGTLTLTTPGRYSLLSFLVAGANGGGDIGFTVHFADGSSQTGTIPGNDWFGNSNIAVDANGRTDVTLTDFNSENSGNPRIYQDDLTLNNLASNVTGVDFTFSGPNRAAVFGLSGQAVPEPTALGLLSVGLLAAFTRRRRS